MPSALSHFRRAVQLGVDDDAEVIRVAVGLLRDLAGTPELRAEAVRAVQALTHRLEGLDRQLRIEFELALAMASSQPAERDEVLGRLRGLLDRPNDTDSNQAAPGLAKLAGTFVTFHDAVGGLVESDDLAGILGSVVDADQLVNADSMVEEIQAMSFIGLLCTDQFSLVDELLGKAQRLARERGNASSEQLATVLAATSLLWQGSLTAAEESFGRGRRLGAQLGGGQQSWVTIGLVDALLRQGRIDEAEKTFEQLRAEDGNPTFESIVRVHHGRLLVARGHFREGLEHFLLAGKDATEEGLINPALSSWRADAAMALSVLGEWDEAGRLADEQLRLARAFGATRALGIALRAAAAATPDPVERTALLTEAVDLLEPSPARLEAAYSLVELGMVLVERKKKEEARGVLRRGANLASLCGAHQLVESAGIQLRAAGARPRRLGTIGPDSLTPAERRVARLAAAGKTNQGIAADLYITVKTVEGHLAKTYRKLGVDSRRSLALALGDGEEDGGELLDASAL
jgi:pentatricopeptide repeat protein